MLPKTCRSFMIADIMKDADGAPHATERRHQSESSSTPRKSGCPNASGSPGSTVSSPDSALTSSPKDGVGAEKTAIDDSGFTSPDRLSPEMSEVTDSGEEIRRYKKARTAFSAEQVNQLEARYKLQKYIPAGERAAFADKLGLSDQQVKTWFQNRRMKEKRQSRESAHFLVRSPPSLFSQFPLTPYSGLPGHPATPHFLPSPIPAFQPPAHHSPAMQLPLSPYSPSMFAAGMPSHRVADSGSPITARFSPY